MIETLSEMTWKNPLFMMVFFGALWFIPGAMVRRLGEKNYKKRKAEKQIREIKKLYPDK